MATKMRMVIVAGLLMLALLGAVLTSIGDHPHWASIPDLENAPPPGEISRQAVPGSLGRG